jgi:hypothetical protein
MSKLWEDLKDNMKDWSVTAVEKAEEMSKIAVAKTEEMTRVSKVKFDIHQLHREMNKVYEELGKLAYKHTKNEHMATFSGNKDFFNLLNKIDELKVEIEKKEKEINKIKEEYGIIESYNDKNNIKNMDAISSEEQVSKDFNDINSNNLKT